MHNILWLAVDVVMLHIGTSLLKWRREVGTLVDVWYKGNVRHSQTLTLKSLVHDDSECAGGTDRVKLIVVKDYNFAMSTCDLLYESRWAKHRKRCFEKLQQLIESTRKGLVWDGRT